MAAMERDAIRVTRSVLLPLAEIELRFSRSSGPGGQHANTAETRVEALFDVDTFVEYGQLVRPASRQLGVGPADGLVMGVGLVEGSPVCAFSYDYTVFGGSQSPRNHRKMDRLLELARRNRWPVVCWSEGITMCSRSVLWWLSHGEVCVKRATARTGQLELRSL